MRFRPLGLSAETYTAKARRATQESRRPRRPTSSRVQRGFRPGNALP